jgi:hypothetical protein
MNTALIIGLIGIVAVVLAVFFIRRMFAFLIHSVIGLFALLLWNWFFDPVVINVWSILIVAIGGVVGFIAVVALHFFGILF